ncbi:hypothetical protein E2320_003397 [Naja naja]|nr:hypothetical protein E2320_003397 [Naja naja]
MSTHAQPEPFDPKKHDWVTKFTAGYNRKEEENSIPGILWKSPLQNSQNPSCTQRCGNNGMERITEDWRDGHTTFTSYNPASETWDSYITCLECFLEANDFAGILSNRKKAYFLSFCGPDIFETVRAVLAPRTVQFVSLQHTLRNHCAAKPLRIAC